MTNCEAKVALVIGSTSRTAKELIPELVRSGFAVRLFARNPDKAQRILQSCGLHELRSIEILPGLPHRPADVSAAVRGCSVVFVVIGAGRLLSVPELLGVVRYSENHAFYVEYMCMRNVIAAAKADGKVQRIVYMTGMGLESPGSVLGLLINVLYSHALFCKMMAENLLRESGIAYSIVRPGKLVEEEVNSVEAQTRKETYKICISQDFSSPWRLLAPVSRKSVAEVLVKSASAKQQKLTIEMYGRRRTGKTEEDFVEWNLLRNDLEQDLKVNKELEWKHKWLPRFLVLGILFMILFLLYKSMMERFQKQRISR